MDAPVLKFNEEFLKHCMKLQQYIKHTNSLHVQFYASVGTRRKLTLREIQLADTINKRVIVESRFNCPIEAYLN